MEKIELMAPAGSYEALLAAIGAGADSVYFGVEQLNMRARATMNFTIDDLPKIAAICKSHGVKSYLTLNTIVYDHDLHLMKAIMDQALQAGITAVIAADQAVIGYASSIGLEVHISTQVNITNIETVRFYAHFADVMVLARELTLSQMTHIVTQIAKEKICGPRGELIRIEVFAHGALCMAVSGKCYLSLHTQNASANRGACIQNCRRRYEVTDLEDGHKLEIDNQYILSPQDLLTIDFLDQLMATGISVLKIEGRGKAPEYVKTVVECYREAIESVCDGSYTDQKVKAWIERLSEVYNRGFWSGYYLGRKLGAWTDQSGSKATTRKIYLGKASHYYPKNKIAEFLLESYDLCVDDRILIMGPTTGVIETKVTSLHVNDQGAMSIAHKGDYCAFPVNEPIRMSDRLYKIANEQGEKEDLPL